MVIPKEDTLFTTKPKSIFGLSYELGVNGMKKVNGNWDIINKNGQSIFHTGQSGSFNSLREVILIIL